MVLNFRKRKSYVLGSPVYSGRVIDVLNSPYSPPDRRRRVDTGIPFTPSFNNSMLNLRNYATSRTQPFTPGAQPTYKKAVSQAMKRMGGSRGYLAGKVRPKKRVSRKLKKGKRKTRLGLQSYGVHSTEEHRFVSKTDQVVADRYECIQIGHASMPAKTVIMAVSRAMIKHVLAKIGPIKNFNDLTENGANGYEIRAGDILRWEYYNNWVTQGPLSNFSVSVGVAETFESLAYKLSLEFQTLSNGLGDGKLTSLRWQQFKYEPSVLYGDNRSHPFYMIDIKTFMCEVEIKSSLKVQNRTVNVVGNDEADDVDNVPLTGMLYKCKGNNVLNKTNRRVLFGVGTGTRINNEVVLFDGIARSAFNLNAPLDAVYNPTETTFSKPSEPAKPYELVNCVKSSKVRINPGGIKTSVLTQKFKLPLSTVIGLCCDDGGNIREILKYNPKLGYTQCFHLEKVIGSNNSSVAIAAEVQYDIWVAITSKGDSKYTNTSAMQVDYGVYP